jgi:hypothetical protein
MFAPLYNDEFRRFLDSSVSGEYETDSQIMARLINPDRTRWDEFSDHQRPALLYIEETARQFGVQPHEIFGRIVNDVLSGETGSGHDLLVELLEWIVLATPYQRTRVLGGFAAHQRLLMEDRQCLHDQTDEPDHVDEEMKPVLADLSQIDTKRTLVGH